MHFDEEEIMFLTSILLLGFGMYNNIFLSSSVDGPFKTSSEIERETAVFSNALTFSSGNYLT